MMMEEAIKYYECAVKLNPEYNEARIIYEKVKKSVKKSSGSI